MSSKSSSNIKPVKNKRQSAKVEYEEESSSTGDAESGDSDKHKFRLQTYVAKKPDRIRENHKKARLKAFDEEEPPTVVKARDSNKDKDSYSSEDVPQPKKKHSQKRSEKISRSSSADRGIELNKHNSRKSKSYLADEEEETDPTELPPEDWTFPLKPIPPPQNTQEIVREIDERFSITRLVANIAK